VTVATVLLASAAVAAGAVIQGSVGFGVGVLGAPLLLLIDPRFVPGPLIATAFLLIILIARRDWHGVRFADLAWSVPGRAIGTGAAVAFLAVIPPEHFSGVVGTLIIIAVGLSAVGIDVPLTRPAFLGAGTLSGFFGTITAVGGPPIALLYQRQQGPVVRGTLSAFFLVGTVISLVGLAFAGRFGLAELKLVPVLLPGALVGYFLSGRAARFLDRGWMRAAILVTSFAAGGLVVVKYFTR
jgi:uncharacterized membrane protein YfcA